MSGGGQVEFHNSLAQFTGTNQTKTDYGGEATTLMISQSKLHTTC